MNKLFILGISVVLLSLLAKGDYYQDAIFGDDAFTQGDDNNPKQSNGDDNNRPYYGNDLNRHSFVDTYNNKPTYGDNVISIVVNNPSYGDTKSSYGNDVLSYNHDKSAFSNDNPSYGDQSNDNPSYGEKLYANEYEYLSFGNDYVINYDLDDEVLTNGNDNFVLNRPTLTAYGNEDLSIRNNKILIDDRLTIDEEENGDDRMLSVGNDELFINEDDVYVLNDPRRPTLIALVNEDLSFGNNKIFINNDRPDEKLYGDNSFYVVKTHPGPILRKPSFGRNNVFIRDDLTARDNVLHTIDDNELISVDDKFFEKHIDTIKEDQLTVNEDEVLVGSDDQD